MMFFGVHAFPALLVALALDAIVGDPDWLWRRAPHPVVLMGRSIARLDGALNRGSARQRRWAGAAAMAILCLAAGGAGVALQWLCAQHPAGLGVEALLVAVLLAQRSLYEHVLRVRHAFGEGLPKAREAVSMIVGRDPNALDEAGVCRAAIETTAENFSDGVVAPAFWFLAAGLPGIFIYKAVNTADSMIGHRTPRHEAFGWAAARLDDALNLIPARLSGFLIAAACIAAGGNARGAFAAMWRDAGRHRSPNAGWPEAAMAGALGLALAGPRQYAGGRVEDAWMNAGGRIEATPLDISQALRLFVANCALLAVAVAALVLLAA